MPLFIINRCQGKPPAEQRPVVHSAGGIRDKALVCSDTTILSWFQTASHSRLPHGIQDPGTPCRMANGCSKRISTRQSANHISRSATDRPNPGAKEQRAKVVGRSAWTCLEHVNWTEHSGSRHEQTRQTKSLAVTVAPCNIGIWPK